MPTRCARAVPALPARLARGAPRARSWRSAQRRRPRRAPEALRRGIGRCLRRCSREVVIFAVTGMRLREYSESSRSDGAVAIAHPLARDAVLRHFGHKDSSSVSVQGDSIKKYSSSTTRPSPRFVSAEGQEHRPARERHRRLEDHFGHGPRIDIGMRLKAVQPYLRVRDVLANYSDGVSDLRCLRWSLRRSGRGGAVPRRA